MNNVQVAFDIQEKGDPLPVGHQFIKCHMIFDVSIEDLRHKSSMVAGRHMTDTPPTIRYVSVVSCDTVGIALTMAEQHDQIVKTSDTMNAYIKATCGEKVLHHLRAGFWNGRRKVGCDCSVIVQA